MPLEELPFVAEIATSDLGRKRRSNLPNYVSEPLKTGKFQNPFENGSNAAVQGNDPSQSSGRLWLSSTPVDIAAEFQNMAAIGGAVGALVLGSWSIIGAMLTPWSAINALIAIVMGFYGLKSKRKRMAVLGIVLAVFGLALSLMELDQNVSRWFSGESSQ